MPRHNNQNTQQRTFPSGPVPARREDGDVNLYNQLLAAGFTKQEIHSFIYKYLMHEISCKKAYKQLSFTGKIKWHVKRYFEQVTAPFKSLTQKGLTLLKTQFAKKPKNPV